jgi:polar amino acid transport system substrate-binding protein
LRVGVTTGSSSDAALSRDFKHAQIVRAATFDVAIEMLSTGAINAYATNKAALFEMAEKLPGSTFSKAAGGSSGTPSPFPKDASRQWLSSANSPTR